ncbi:MFS general substrate transporter [Vararia minispora EC-137]|uniref:MFS general substrate transporter n=1 Tax=Vararia minispora EC-137 TaxID=1314806 RepID=A0ACB8QWA0_9AGAM|nr:MFS general substrate transporter [Vararia minispora EC-137]
MASQRTLYTDPDHCSLSPQPPSPDSDESRTLLAHAVYPSTDSRDTLAGITPLPIAQLACLCICRITDPIMFTQILPYVNQMMTDLHVTDDPSRIGFYSGLVESSFAVAQVLSIYHWARLSDVIGRRPVILLAILGMALGSLFFGLSGTLTSVMLSRSVSGFFSGNVAVLHSLLGELTDASNQAIAFPIYGLTWPLGAIIGPLIGGTFSNPADRFPWLFAAEFWRTYPYFLPGFIASVVAFVGFGFGYFFLEETLPSKRRNKSKRALSSEDLSAWDDDKQDGDGGSKPPTMRELLAVPAIRALCLSGSAQSFTSTAFDVLFVLMCYSPIETGGLALSASEIGAALAMAGIISVLLQMFVIPVLLARCDLVRLYRTTLGLWTYCFALLPLIGLFARTALASTETDAPLNLAMATSAVRAGVWVAIAVLLALSKLACLPYAISMILVKMHAPGAKALGVSNGLVQFSMSFTRAFSPAFASSIFALSLDCNLLGGYFWALVMMFIGVLGTRVCNSLEGGQSISGAEAAAAMVAE